MVSRYMDNKKNDKYYAEQALEQIVIIDKYVGNKSYEEFMSDDQLVDAVMFRLIQMIENIKNISSEFKDNNLQIPWGKIMGFRNGIVHEYGNTDYTIVYEVVINNIKPLRDVLETLG